MTNGFKVGISVILLILLFIGLGFLVFNHAEKGGVSTEEKHKETDSHTEEVNEESLSYYYEGGEGDAEKIQFYTLTPTLQKTDERLGSFPGTYFVLPSGSLGVVLLQHVLSEERSGGSASLHGYALELFDISSREKDTLHTFKEGTRLNDAFLFDANTVLYTTSNESRSIQEDELRGHLSFFDREAGTTTRTISLTVAPVRYGTYSILGVNKNTGVVYIQSSGGDAGSLWGSLYTLDLETEEFTKRSQFSSAPSQFGFVRSKEGEQWGKVSPNGKRSVYTSYSTSSEAFNPSFFKKDRALQRHSAGLECLSYEYRNKYDNQGGVIMVREISSGEKTEVYRNLEFEDNLCKLAGRQISGIVWRDNDTLVFSTLLGIYELDLNETNENAGTIQELYNFPLESSSPAERRQPSVLRVEGRLVGLSDGSVVNTETDKRIILPALGERNRRASFVEE